jgi:beta-hydroxyacyl-ACP dehydratase FabZ
MDNVMDIQKILNLMPHRYPFLLVDRVLEIEAGRKIRALKNVTFNEPFFQGHFPGAPIMPGVLIIEAMAQAGGLLFLDSEKHAERDFIFYFMAIDKVRFRKPVVPGDQLFLEAEILRRRSKTIKMANKAIVDGKIVAEAELMASIAGKGETS